MNQRLSGCCPRAGMRTKNGKTATLRTRPPAWLPSPTARVTASSRGSGSNSCSTASLHGRSRLTIRQRSSPGFKNAEAGVVRGHPVSRAALVDPGEDRSIMRRRHVCRARARPCRGRGRMRRGLQSAGQPGRLEMRACSTFATRAIDRVLSDERLYRATSIPTPEALSIKKPLSGDAVRRGITR